MISIHTSCRLEQYAYITNTEKQSCRSCCGKFIIHSTICTCRVALNGTNTDIFHYGNCQSLCMLLKKKVICMMNICHLQMNRDKINSRGESTDFVDSKPDLHTRHFAYSHCPPLSACSRMPYEIEVVGHSRFALNQAQNTPWCILHFSPPIHLHLRQGIEEKFKFRPNRVDNHNQASLGRRNEWRLRRWRSKKGGTIGRCLLAWCLNVRVNP